MKSTNLMQCRGIDFFYLPSVRYTFRRCLVPPLVCRSLTCEHPVKSPMTSVWKYIRGYNAGEE